MEYVFDFFLPPFHGLFVTGKERMTGNRERMSGDDMQQSNTL